MTSDDSIGGVPCPSDLKRNENIFITGASEQLRRKTFALILERSAPEERVTNQSDRGAVLRSQRCRFNSASRAGERAPQSTAELSRDLGPRVSSVYHFASITKILCHFTLGGIC
jgi:hypothetical protein